MKRIMIDIETLGLDAGSVILQVAMVEFNTEYAECSMFDENISVVDQVLHGATTTKSTIEFWQNQIKSDGWGSPEIESMFYSTSPMQYVADALNSWLKAYEYGTTEIWANGLLFDIPKIDNLLRLGGYETLQNRFHHRAFHDLRTYIQRCELAAPLTMADIRTSLDGGFGQKHEAYNDCMYQIAMLNMLNSFMALRFDMILPRDK